MSSGVISDGPGDLSPNSNCKWLISSVSEILLQFRSFDLENPLSSVMPQDFVTISQCESSKCLFPEQIAKLSGKGGDDTVYSSRTGFLKIELSSPTAGAYSMPGFEAVWRTDTITSCVDCRPGTYAKVSGASTCSLCEAGKFQNTTGGSACHPCADIDIHSTSAAGSTDLNACYCNVGFQKSYGSGSCKACEAGKYKGPLFFNMLHTQDFGTPSLDSLFGAIVAVGGKERCIDKDSICSGIASGILNCATLQEIGFSMDVCCACNGVIEASIFACLPLNRELSGHIALINDGDCGYGDPDLSIYLKALHAQDAGAKGVVIFSNSGEMLKEMRKPGYKEQDIYIPAVYVGRSAGEKILELLSNGSIVEVAAVSGSNSIGVSTLDCLACPEGTFTNVSGASVCQSCAADSTSSSGSTSMSDCKYFADLDVDSDLCISEAEFGIQSQEFAKVARGDDCISPEDFQILASLDYGGYTGSSTGKCCNKCMRLLSECKK